MQALARAVACALCVDELRWLMLLKVSSPIAITVTKTNSESVTTSAKPLFPQSGEAKIPHDP